MYALGCLCQVFIFDANLLSFKCFSDVGELQLTLGQIRQPQVQLGWTPKSWMMRLRSLPVSAPNPKHLNLNLNLNDLTWLILGHLILFASIVLTTWQHLGSMSLLFSYLQSCSWICSPPWQLNVLWLLLKPVVLEVNGFTLRLLSFAMWQMRKYQGSSRETLCRVALTKS